ncbi:RNA polymerase sigma factor [Desulfosarcina ovata subsp. sediminis]|uniref:RNA polymerase sigma factor n=1 Tax=Desulfosarcina ovata subsp. sediminis TaxID=885957 RepID=A0A5K7ZTY3_9BACT|nr:sigma-70 family RNA polymerase sigma factor [Desulfosarcina ovata]BBO83681.1 RNA polymerase sigma factor [Desulfosarcina ovata subsp. sediminis]
MIFRSRHIRRSDADLVARVADGDEGAFRELLKRHQDAVYGFAWRMLRDPQEAEDITQEAFLRLYQAAGRYRPKASLRTFLLRIAKNLCIDYYRKKRPERIDPFPDIPGSETPLGLLENAIDADRLEKAIDGLPVNQRTAIVLRHTQQLPYQRIADVMDLSVGAVESLLVRARRRLREVLREDG